MSNVLSHDITRRVVARAAHERRRRQAAPTLVHEGIRVVFAPEFKAYAVERVREVDRFLHDSALVEIGRALDVAPKTLHRWIKDDERGRLPTLTDDRYAEFRRWEDARGSNGLGPLRAFVKSVFGVTQAERGAKLMGLEPGLIEPAYAALDEAAQADMRPAVDAYLMAAELATEVRRLLDLGAEAANAAYERRRAEAAA